MILFSSLDKQARHLVQKICASSLTISLLFCAAQPTQAADEQAFDVKAWQQDYAYLKTQLELQYANLAWFATAQGKVDLPELDRYTRQALAQTGNDEQASTVLRNFIAAFHDGHLRPYVNPYNKPADKPTLPLTVMSEPAEPAIQNLEMAAACAAIGVGSNSKIPFSLPVETLPGFQLLADGAAQAFRAGIISSDKGVKIGMVRIPRFREQEYSGLCDRAWNKLRSEKQEISTRKLKSALADAWFEVLAGHLQRLREEGAVALIVDVGGNGGGNDFGDWSARLFTTRPVHSASMLMAAGPIATAYLDEELGGMRKAYQNPDYAKLSLRPMMQEAIAAFEKDRLAVAEFAACDMSWVWKERRAWQPEACSRLVRVGFASGPYDYLHVANQKEKDYAGLMYWPANIETFRGSWNGPVYLLTDRGVGSAAEAFVAIMKDNGIAKTIGGATGGSGCGNMQKIRPMVLPHSKLSFQAPDCMRLRKDGSNEVMGIQPDFPLTARQGESERALAARLILTVAEDISRPGK